MTKMMSKEQFKKCVDELQLVSKYHTELNDFFESHDVEGYIYQPDLLTTVLNLLYIMFDDKDEWISYFIFELDFGQASKDGCVTDKNNVNIPLKTTDDLYDLLMSNLKR